MFIANTADFSRLSGIVFHFMEAQGLTSGCLLSAHLVTSLSPEAQAVS